MELVKPNKVKFYLDQNVIDYLVKGKLNVLEELIHQIQNSGIIYSYVTLRELARIKDDLKRKPYLDYLKNSNAEYFWIDENEIAHFEDVDPHTKFNENNSTSEMIKSCEDSMHKVAHKLLGGKKDISFDEIASAQEDSFNQLMEFFNKTLDALEENPLINKEFLKKSALEMKAHFAELVDNFTQQIKDNNQSNEDPLNELRKLFNIHVDSLNEIEPPNVINQIWDKMKDGIKNNNINITYDDLFGDGVYKLYTNQKISTGMKINILYNLLNSLGFHTDKNFRNDKKFVPFINDQHHIANAIYSNFFVTRDRRLMRKTEAVYEHLKIRTKIIFVSPTK